MIDVYHNSDDVKPTYEVEGKSLARLVRCEEMVESKNGKWVLTDKGRDLLAFDS